MAAGLLWTQAKAYVWTLGECQCDCVNCDPRGLSSSETRGVSHVRDHMQPRWPSHVGANGESIFFSVDSSPFVFAWHFGEPLKGSAIQERPTSNVSYSEGGIASSTRAAQFIKALTRIVWRVVGRSTSLRLVQCTKVNSGISATLVLQRSTLLSSRQLSHACAPMAVKCFVRASAVIPVELRQPGASSLVLVCSVDPWGDGISLKVISARLMHP